MSYTGAYDADEAREARIEHKRLWARINAAHNGEPYDEPESDEDDEEEAE